MTDARVQIQIFYEIAMSIGNSLDIRKMLKEALSTYLRKLNCSAGMVLETKLGANLSAMFDPVFSIPRRAERNSACQAGLDQIREGMAMEGLSRFKEKLPIRGTDSGGRFFHIMELPEFGFLLLVKGGMDFEFSIVPSLKPLNAKLADSCIACRKNEESGAVNRRLVHEISERREIEATLKNVLNDLETRVEDRTRKLKEANEKLLLEIRERKQMELALRESEEKYRIIFDHIQDVYFSCTFDGIITEISPSLETVSGYDRNSVIGSPFHTHQKDPSVFKDFLHRLQREKHLKNYEITFTDNKGSTRIGSVNARVIAYAQGAESKIVGSIRDITELREAELEKRELEQKLARSRKMEALGLLAGGVAHDLNNVLSGIVSYPELLLLKLPEDSPMRKPLKVIQDSGLKAASIVQDLLDLARRAVVQTGPVNLNEILREYLSSPEFEKLIAYHPQVTIQSETQPDLAHVKGSSIHLRKAVMNLISNAAEAGGKKIKIFTENRYVDQPIQGYDTIQKGDFVVLKVEDDGIGISDEDISRIFEPFFTKKVMGRSGTGLGMAVVWGTVQDHGGYIDIKSIPHQSTVFSLYFPASQETPVETETHPPAEALRAKGESVLVVDDVEAQRRIAREILELMGYAVVAVKSGEDALEYLRNHETDIVLLDMIMDPGMDGLDTYRGILEIRPDQKVLIASGFSETDRVTEALRLGASAYVSKPYSVRRIAAALRDCLDGSS